MLSKCSVALVLDLIEDRINQLDPLVPRDARDLQDLLRCREEMKVTALIAASADREQPMDTTWHSGQTIRHQTHARSITRASLDVI